MNDTVGFEVVTPLVLPDGFAILIDRGWLPPESQSVTVAPVPPAAPTGDVVVVGRVHAPESQGETPQPFDGRLRYGLSAGKYVVGETDAGGLSCAEGLALGGQ